MDPAFSLQRNYNGKVYLAMPSAIRVMQINHVRKRMTHIVDMEHDKRRTQYRTGSEAFRHVDYSVVRNNFTVIRSRKL